VCGEIRIHKGEQARPDVTIVANASFVVVGGEGRTCIRRIVGRIYRSFIHRDFFVNAGPNGIESQGQTFGLTISARARATQSDPASTALTETWMLTLCPPPLLRVIPLDEYVLFRSLLGAGSFGRNFALAGTGRNRTYYRLSSLKSHMQLLVRFEV